jgi:hypothetical protein
MKVTVKITIPDDEKCEHCTFFDEYCNGFPMCEVFGSIIENGEPCKECIMVRFGESKTKEEQEPAKFSGQCKHGVPIGQRCKRCKR